MPEPTYSALLAAYPARFRRRHGAELITTMLELTGPDGRPSRADRWRVVADGLRERFRLPAGRPLAVLTATLALLIGGALGAAAGSSAGTYTYGGLPDADALATTALGPDGTPDHRSAGRTYLSTADALAPGIDPADAARGAQRRLAAAGWATGPVIVVDGDGEILRDAHFDAARDDAEIDVYAYAFRGGAPLLQIAGWPVRPPAYLWLVLTGMLVGMVAGWLAAAALAHRIAAAGRPRSSALLALTGLLMLTPPAISFAGSLGCYLTAATPEPVAPFTFGPSLPVVRELGLPGSFAVNQTYHQLAVLGLAAIVVAALLARPGTGRRTVTA